MTAIHYPDCEAASPNGRFKLEARSPHNGTINHQNGKPATPEEFGFKYREHQTDFRFQLIDAESPSIMSRIFGATNAQIVWERWQPRDEDSPHEVVVSDSGWSIIRTHGFKPEVIAISKKGQIAIRIEITMPESGEVNDETEPTSHRKLGANVWRTETMSLSTAGLYWTEHSWRYFFELDGVEFFAWRAYSGQRLLMDLTNATYIEESAIEKSTIATAMRKKEIHDASLILSYLAKNTKKFQQLLANRDSDEMKLTPLVENVMRTTAAILLAGAHRIVNCIPFLQALEKIDWPSYSKGSTAMPGYWWLECQTLRPLLHHVLRLLGSEPQGYATYYFIKDKQRFPVPERIANRREIANAINLNNDAEQVLSLIGSPDYVVRHSHPDGRGLYTSTEDWEYDFLSDNRWTTLRITWEEKSRKGRMTHIEAIEPYWLVSNLRETEILLVSYRRCTLG